MKFPYGITDFKEIVTNDYLYCDRTRNIPLLERAKSQLFIRPRRFGKSLLLSMLEHYYDVARRDEFEEIFGELQIGKNPTELRNSFFILRLDFSCVDAGGSTEYIRQSLYNHINACIDGFCRSYRHKGYDIPEFEINPTDAVMSLRLLTNAVNTLGIPVYLLIDEYDNFANTVMMQGGGTSRERYQELVHDQGVLKTLFKAIKSSTSSTGFDRVFITGVSPVVLSDITSGYNIAENIYFSRRLNDLCGFREAEVRQALSDLITECGLAPNVLDQAMTLVRSYYDGYRFYRGDVENVYNPTLCLYFFKQFQEECEFPRKMLDANLAVDQSKLRYVAQLPNGPDLLGSLMQWGQEVTVNDLEDRFGLEEMLNRSFHSQKFLLSFLYYFGVLTLSGEDEQGELKLKVPNLVMQSLYIERVQMMLLPDPAVRDAGQDAAGLVYKQGDIGPLCTFIQNDLFQVFRNRDYRWANELTLKTAFLTLLYNDILFIMDSEPEIGRGYADMTMIIRPDMRRFQILDVLLEFKFLSLGDLKLTGQQLREADDDQIRALPVVARATAEAEDQARRYMTVLEKKYDDLRLQTFVVVSLGFERIVWEKIE